MKETVWSRPLLLWKAETGGGAARLAFSGTEGAGDEAVVGSALLRKSVFRK
jgi:hypothetical protein